MGVVDRQQSGPLVGKIGGQPVEPVERPEGRVSTLGGDSGPSCPSSRLESPAAPAKRASRSASVAELTRCSNSWRATPKANSCSSTAPCASNTRSPPRGRAPVRSPQPALADPGRRLDQKGASGALACPRDGFPKGLQLALALEQVGIEVIWLPIGAAGGPPATNEPTGRQLFGGPPPQPPCSYSARSSLPARGEEAHHHRDPLLGDALGDHAVPVLVVRHPGGSGGRPARRNRRDAGQINGFGGREVEGGVGLAVLGQGDGRRLGEVRMRSPGDQTVLRRAQLTRGGSTGSAEADGRHAARCSRSILLIIAG